MERQPGIGSIISGTLRKADLLRAFTGELQALDTAGRYVELITEAQAANPESAHVHEVLRHLEEALGEFALPYCYFGTHPGDAADFGYWPDWDAIEQDRRGGTLLSGAELPAGGSADRYYLHISDHGNAELYEWDVTSRRWRSVWSVV